VVNIKTGKKKNKATKDVTAIGKALRALGGIGGATASGMLGMNTGVGSAAGTQLGAIISRWLGFGDYRVKSNSLLRVDSSGSIPMMHNTGQSIIVRHKEYVCDVIAGTGAPTGFNISNRFYLNPGLEASFPWLSTIAQQYQEYSWRGVVYHFISTSGEYSAAMASTSLGSVMLHTDYRVTAPAPGSKVELLNEYFACDARPTECFIHPIECDPKENPYNVQYVRSGAVPAGEDPKTYDLGVVSVASQGIPVAGTNLGELWVTYEVELRKPQIVGAIGSSTPSAYYSSGAAGAATFFGLSPTAKFDNIGLTIIGNVMTFPSGSTGAYLVGIWHSKAGAPYDYPNLAFTLVNCVKAVPWSGGSGHAYLSGAAITNVSAGGPSVMFLITISDPTRSASVTITPGGAMAMTATDIAVASFAPVSGVTY
jgi:hypothetical protein